MYSLDVVSFDEMIMCDVCYGCYLGEVVFDLIVCVVDVINLCLYLCFVFEV